MKSLACGIIALLLSAGCGGESPGTCADGDAGAGDGADGGATDEQMAALEGARFRLDCTGPLAQASIDYTFASTRREGTDEIRVRATGSAQVERLSAGAVSAGIGGDPPCDCRLRFVPIPGDLRYLTMRCVGDEPQRNEGLLFVQIGMQQDPISDAVVGEAATAIGATVGSATCDTSISGNQATYSFTFTTELPFTVINATRTVSSKPTDR